MLEANLDTSSKELLSVARQGKPIQMMMSNSLIGNKEVRQPQRGEVIVRRVGVKPPKGLFG